MAGSAIRIVSESILYFLQSLTKGSYFQLIGFGSTFKKINDKPLEYNKENVKNTMDIIKNLKADLGGTDISSPLKEIFNSKDYDNINLARNLFILTDGEVDNREECLGLINTHSDKFKVHAIGIGSSFDKKLIQNAGIQGRGTYHFVSNVSDVNSIIIESLSKCLRNYVLNAKLSLNELKPEYEFIPKMNFIYPDEILNYYFILKGKDHDKIQINLEKKKKNENYLFTKEKIIPETDGDIIGQIIILSKKTSLFAVAENEENNKIGELKQITKKKKEEELLFGLKNLNNFSLSGMSPNNMMIGANNYRHKMNMNADYDMAYSAAPKQHAMMMAAPKYEANDDSDNDDEREYKKSYSKAKESKKKRCELKDKCDYMMAMNDDNDDMEVEADNEEDNYAMRSSPFEDDYGELKMNIEKGVKKCEKKIEIKKVEFSNKELVLTQDIFDGCWNLNDQTKLLIEKEKDAFNKIEAILKEKHIDKEEVKMTLLVLYYLNTNSSINKVEYMLIIKKGISYLDENGIKFDEILETLKK